MAVQYLLPCKCGNTTPIDASQAGSSVVCSCGEKLDVPSLRAIRELTPLASGTEVRKYQWNPTAGWLFVGGVIVALLGAGAAYFMHQNSLRAIGFDLPPEDDVAAWIAEVDSAEPEELIDIWNVSRHLGLGDYHMSPFVQARMISQQYAIRRNIGLIVMVCGIACATTSIFLRSKPA